MAVYAGAEVRNAPHPEAAQLWLSFIRSPTALSILERYGFERCIGGLIEKGDTLMATVSLTSASHIVRAVDKAPV